MEKNRNSNSQNCPKKQGMATPEIFPITQQQKCELGILAINLKKVDKSFNLHLFLLRRRKVYKHFPPADKVIRICRHLLANRQDFKGIKLWGYMTVAVSKEEAMSFAAKNIDEHKAIKKMQPLGSIFRDDFLKRGK